jgi:hypothetical protein
MKSAGSPDWRDFLAALLALPALHDEGVEAARNACVAGASIASAAITAAAWYDNPLTGISALREGMVRLSSLRAPFEVERWVSVMGRTSHPETGDPDFSPGFGFVTDVQARLVLAVARRLGSSAHDGELPYTTFFLRNRSKIVAATGSLNATGLSALQFLDHAVAIDEAERRFLLWRIEPAVIEAQRARENGLGSFPFFTEQYVYEGSMPKPRPLDLAALMKEVGLS